MVYGLDPAWEDIQYIAGASGKSSHEVLEHIQAVYRKNARRLRDPAKLMEKVASAYSRLTELTEEEQTLEERCEALSHQRPMDEKQMQEVATRLRQVRERTTQLRALQKKWREESEKVLRIPSKEVAKIFGISPAAVDKRVERIGRQVRELFNRVGEDDES
jgi:DNA repair ATPase RecN